MLLADSYSHRIRRVELETDLYSIPPVTEVPCPVGTIRINGSNFAAFIATWMLYEHTLAQRHIFLV